MPSQSPLRVVLDARGSLAHGSLLDTSVAPTLVCTTAQAPAAALELWRRAGVEVCELPAGHLGGVELRSVLRELQSRGVLQVMVEGGGKLLGAWLAEGAAQQLRLYLGACALGSTAQRWIQAPIASTIADSQRWQLLSVVRLGDDVRIDYQLMSQPESNRKTVEGQ